jgi:hypothetical protein
MSDLKPFDLEAALRGEPVVTRDGRPVTQLHLFKDTTCNLPLIGVVNHLLQNFTEEGKYIFAEDDSRHDLFMAPKKKKLFISIRKSVRPYRIHSTSCGYESIEDLLAGYGDQGDKDVIVEVEIEV